MVGIGVSWIVNLGFSFALIFLVPFLLIAYLGNYIFDKSNYL